MDKPVLLLVGGGVANLYSACYGFRNNILQKYKVIVIEKGKLLHERGSKDIVYGLFGAGAFSDNKNVFSFQEDQPVFKYLSKDIVTKYYNILEEIIHNFLPSNDITYSYPTEIEQPSEDITLKQSKVIHIGSKIGYEMCMNMYNYLVEQGVEFTTEADFQANSELDKHIATYKKNGQSFDIKFDKCIIALGRSGGKTIRQVYQKYNIKNIDNEIHFGFRFECPFTATMEHFVKNIQYDFKFSKDIKGNLTNIRTFCVNHGSAEVVAEEVEGFTIDIRKQANGHSIYSLADTSKWTGKSNWAILGTFKRSPAEVLTFIEQFTNGEIKEFTNENYHILKQKLNEMDNFGSELETFINTLCKYFQFNTWKVYFPEIKIISPTTKLNSDFSTNELGNDIRFVGDSGASTRGIIPAATTAIHAINTLS